LVGWLVGWWWWFLPIIIPDDRMNKKNRDCVPIFLASFRNLEFLFHKL
jgi:hypothetical protein